MEEDFFTECGQSFTQQLGELFRDEAHSASLLSRIACIIYDHGMTTTHTDVNGVQWSSEFAQLEAALALSRELIESGDIAAFRQTVKKGVQQLQKQTSELLFKKVGEAAESVGNVIDAGGKPLSGKTLSDMLDRIEFSFDDKGRIEFPTLVCSSDVYEQIQSLLEKPDVRLRIDAILTEKWFARYTLRLT